MPIYRCLFVGRNGDIQETAEIPAGTIAEAIELAQTMLLSDRKHHGLEIWLGGERVYPSTRDTPGNAMRDKRRKTEPSGCR